MDIVFDARCRSLALKYAFIKLVIASITSLQLLKNDSSLKT